jgi:hypothetical protein
MVEDTKYSPERPAPVKVLSYLTEDRGDAGSRWEAATRSVEHWQLQEGYDPDGCTEGLRAYLQYTRSRAG